MAHPTRIGGIAGEMFLYVYIYHNHGLPQKKVKQGLANDMKSSIVASNDRFLHDYIVLMQVYTNKVWVAKELWMTRGASLELGKDYIEVDIVKKWDYKQKGYVSVRNVITSILEDYCMGQLHDRGVKEQKSTWCNRIYATVDKGVALDKLRAIQDKLIIKEERN